jgi:hypothetical protein
VYNVQYVPVIYRNSTKSENLQEKKEENELLRGAARLRYRERRHSFLALFDNLDSQHFLQSDCRGVPVFSCLETNAPLEEDIFFREIVKRQRRGEENER